MVLQKGMEFLTTEHFVSNIFQSKTVQIIDIDQTSVSISYYGSRGSGTFPIEQFHSFVKKGILIPVPFTTENN